MLILGDLACPNLQKAYLLKAAMERCGIFRDQLLVCNLEGVVSGEERYQDEKLFNHPGVLEIFESGKTILSLANNHMYDYPELIQDTLDVAESKGLRCVGVTKKTDNPLEFEWNGKEYAVFAHCWSVYTKTNPNRVNAIRIEDRDYSAFFQTVQRYIELHKKHRVICYFHWNYDLEALPLPMHRKLARDLIDAGVYAVIGNHSHLPQGGETYRGRPVVYGLGNFYLPSRIFFGGKLVYPEQSKTMMVLEIDDETGSATCHWFTTDTETGLAYLGKERFEDGKMIKSYSPYRGADLLGYEKYFKNNRSKSLLVPLFRNYAGAGYKARLFWAIRRITIIKLLENKIHPNHNQGASA